MFRYGYNREYLREELMEVHVRRWNGTWYPTTSEFYDATVEVEDETAETWMILTEDFFGMSDAIEAQIHGRADDGS